MPDIMEMLSTQDRLLADIVKSTRLLTPDILATTVVQNTNNGLINDANVHKIWFEVGGKIVEVHKLLIVINDQGWDEIKLSLDVGAQANHGWSGLENDTNAMGLAQLLNIHTHNLYIHNPNGVIRPYFVNQPSETANPREAWIWGWTIDPRL